MILADLVGLLKLVPPVLHIILYHFMIPWSEVIDVVELLGVGKIDLDQVSIFFGILFNIMIGVGNFLHELCDHLLLAIIGCHNHLQNA